jgi:Tfp pilus assembly protein PilE
MIQIGYTFQAVGQFFISIDGYLTILTLLMTNLLAAILASIAKEKYSLYIKKGIKIEV